MSKPKRKVVTFRASSIGDCLMALYFLENVHAVYPAARCGIVVASRGAMIKDLLAAYPWIEVIEANRRRPAAVWHLFRRFWGSDVVLTQYTGGRVPFTTKMVARLLAYKGTLIGFADTSALTLLLYSSVLRHGNGALAPRLLERRALDAAGIPVTQEKVAYTYGVQQGFLGKFEIEKHKYIIVHLFSGSINRGLSPERRQALVDAVAAEFSGMPMLLTGTPREQEELAHLRVPPHARLVGTTVQEMAQLLDNAACVVSVGTGTSHIAAALGAPLAVLVNCRGVQWVGKEQWGDAPIAVFCNPDSCPGGHDFHGYAPCMDSVDMPEVARAAISVARYE